MSVCSHQQFKNDALATKSYLKRTRRPLSQIDLTAYEKAKSGLDLQKCVQMKETVAFKSALST
jgi:hypothetical protein